MVSACGMLNVQAVYGLPPDTVQVSPAPTPTTTPGEILDETIELQGVYGPPQEFSEAISSEGLERMLDEIFGSEYVYGPPSDMSGFNISAVFQDEFEVILPEFQKETQNHK